MNECRKPECSAEKQEIYEEQKEKIMEIVFLFAACVSILAVALICVFLFANGMPAMKKSLCRFSAWYDLETGK